MFVRKCSRPLSETPQPELIRCGWVGDDPLMIAYHDREWGQPVHDDQQLFEALLLEGAQAGLSWRTILNKRQGYREAFGQFSPDFMAGLGKVDIDRLLGNPAIVRHRGKIEAFITNARAYLQLRETGMTLDQFVWQFTEGKPVVNRWQKLADVPGQTPVSTAMSKALKQAGFRFVGPTTCYAFMQSAGLVNDHLLDCRHHPEFNQ